MNKPEWIKYTGSDKQIEEIKTASKGILCKLNSDEGKIKQIMLKSWHSLDEYSDLITEYLICQPHPYADLIKIWADTGCPVYWRSKHGGAAGACHENFPPFAHPNEFEYLLTPFED